jgi:hypothetical protein
MSFSIYLHVVHHEFVWYTQLSFDDKIGLWIFFPRVQSCLPCLHNNSLIVFLTESYVCHLLVV